MMKANGIHVLVERKISIRIRVYLFLRTYVVILLLVFREIDIVKSFAILYPASEGGTNNLTCIPDCYNIVRTPVIVDYKGTLSILTVFSEGT